MNRVVILWTGFPPCGMLASNLILDDPDVTVFVTKSEFEHETFYVSIEKELIVLQSPEEIADHFESFSCCKLFIHTGWDNPGVRKFSRRIKQTFDTKLCLVSDNSQKFNIRQLLGRIYSRIILTNLYDFVITPGKNGRRLLTSLGFQQSRIFEGNYGAFSNFFFRDKSIKKKKQFIFVGQLINRKSVLELTEAFQCYKKNGGKWDLLIIGSGELQDSIPQVNGLYVKPFSTVDSIRRLFNESRVNILVSKIEHWGTVVAESAACGCAQILTESVGAFDEILIPGANGYVMKKPNPREIERALHIISSMDDDWFHIAEQLSINKASCYREETYTNTINFLKRMSCND